MRPLVTPVAAAVAVLARLPFLGHAPSPDEAGFLLVGAQWHGAGSSLYGNYWVDRPPLLITIFRLASSWGGLTALRLMGCVTVLLIVLGAAQVARLVAGEAAGRWAAVTAAALCVSPLLGGYAVNGEMLAAPFVVGGVIAVCRALRAPGRTARVWALAAGVSGVCALLVKQNFADVAVFGAVALLVSWRQGDISRRRLATLSAWASAGAVAALGVAALWTTAHGTSVKGVFDAMYPFRVRASQVMAAGSPHHASARLDGLVAVAAVSGLAVVAVMAGVDAVTHRRREPLSWAALALVVFASASALLGGNYWHHYLVGLVVPVSVVAGLLAAERRPAPRLVIGYAVASAIVAWSVGLTMPQGSAGQTVGQAVKAVAGPTDSIVNLYGHPDIVEASGLGSPYPELWSLPTKTLDPGLTQLSAVLSGADAPTWLVTGHTIRSWGLRTEATVAVVKREYSRRATICGRVVYLHRGIDRETPGGVTSCDATPSPLTTMKELQP